MKNGINVHEPVKVMMPERPLTLQEWLAYRIVPTLNNKPIRYAMWWIGRFLSPSSERVKYLDFDGGHRLFVTFQGRRYEVVAVNLTGAITLRHSTPIPLPPSQEQLLTVLFQREADFTDWSNTPTGPLDESKFVPQRTIFHGSVN